MHLENATRVETAEFKSSVFEYGHAKYLICIYIYI